MLINRELYTKQFVGLILANMFFWMSTNIFMPVLPLYYHSLGMNDHQVGMAVGAFSIGAILFRIFSGKAVDRYGGTRIIAGGIVLSTVAIISYAYSHTLLTASLSRFFHGVGISFYSAAALTTASLIHSDKHTAEALAAYTLFAMFGVGIANAGANYLYQFGSLPLVLVVGGIATLLSLLLYPKKPRLYVRSAAPAAALPITAVISLPAVYVPTLSLLAVQFCFGSAMTFMPLLMLSHHSSEISPFYIAYAIMVIFSRAWVSQLCSRYTAQRVAYAILLLFSVSMLVVGLFPSTLTLVLCGAGLGIGYGLAFPSLATIITGATQPANRGAAFGVYTTAVDAGIGIGSIGMGFVAGEWGYTAVFLTASVYVLLYALFYRTVLWPRLDRVINKG
jgi:MFS family permease